MAVTIRNLQYEPEDFFSIKWNETVNNPLCKGFLVNQEKGQDSLACCKCHLIRKLLYHDRVVSLEDSSETFSDVSRHPLDFRAILEKHPFIEFLSVTCGDMKYIVYPLRRTLMNIDLVIPKLKEQFLERKRLGIIDREIQELQIYNRVNHYPVIMPSPSTQRRSITYTGKIQDTIVGEGYASLDGTVQRLPEDAGVTIKNRIITVDNLDKAFESGKYMYIINLYQTLKLLYPTEKIPQEIF